MEITQTPGQVTTLRDAEPRFGLRAHDGHFHVTDVEDDNPVLDDRPSNFWVFDTRGLADRVVARLNASEDAALLRLQIEAGELDQDGS